MDELKGIGILAGLMVLVVLGCIANPIAIVDVGERGVKTTLGKVSPESFSEGVHFVTPFISHIHTMDVKTQKSNIATTVFTKDIQQARLTYVVNYNLQPENVHKMYREVGKDYKDKVVIPIVEGTIKNVIGGWNASDLIANLTAYATNTGIEELTNHALLRGANGAGAPVMQNGDALVSYNKYTTDPTNTYFLQDISNVATWTTSTPNVNPIDSTHPFIAEKPDQTAMYYSGMMLIIGLNYLS